MFFKISPMNFMNSSQLISVLFLSNFFNIINGHHFTIEEATIKDIHLAFTQKRLTSRQLTDFYLTQVHALNPLLRSVLELNPEAQDQADEADREREEMHSNPNQDCTLSLGDLHGIPVLLKDSIGTKDELNTSCGSYALLGSRVAREAHVVEKLRRSGAVILGKASLSEWYNVRSLKAPNGWCARAGQAVNPYVEWGDPCGSSSGSAISVAANMVAVSLGTETDGSIICPADHNSVVGFKPTVGLTSRAGVIPISPRQDTIGPICRTVSDAVYVLDAIVGFDPRDFEATEEAAKFIPVCGYKQFLKEDGLEGKRLGIVRNPFLDAYNDSTVTVAFERHLNTLRQKGATILDNLEIANLDIILDPYQSGELVALLAEFKVSINQYLEELNSTPVKSLADIIAFNSNNPDLEKMKEYGQGEFLAAEATSGVEEEEVRAIEMMGKLSKEGFEKLMKENNLDAMVTIGVGASSVLAIGGYPAITVPAGYGSKGMPFGICFGGLRGTEPKLIEVAYGFEQATMSRKPPSPRNWSHFLSMD
ncbi:Amidase domain-containing protein [Cephalotus follicularis]|uniref:Amidase domain-containing protein n=1 Tax=Cephalotus follicularis TaxID=3775 RepID=A0A1Q3CKD0_CEPFO|nr:Amidase domain-containing protein [Cephalotus follicularis]